jgi:hypothetical protein
MESIRSSDTSRSNKTKDAALSFCRDTRSATLLGAIDRLLLIGKVEIAPLATDGRSSRFCIHFLGADENECPIMNSKCISDIYSPLFEKLESLQIEQVVILFSGPNLFAGIPVDSIENKIDFFFSSKLHVTVYGSSSLYHQIDRSTLFAANPDDAMPSLVIMYNPGIWGYKSWLDTLSVLHEDAYSNKLKRSSPAFVLTSYTLEEAEEDYDTIVAHYEGKGLISRVWSGQDSDGTELAKCSNNDRDESIDSNNDNADGGALWLWECQSNPHCTSLELERKSKATGIYRDSQIWSSFVFQL